MLKRAHGDKNLALRMYNAGLKPTAYNKPAVRAYADDVQGRQASYGGAGAATPNNPLGDTPSGNQAAWDRRRAALKLSEMTGMPASQILNQGIAKGDMVKIAPWAKFNAQNEATAAALKVQGIDAATKAGGMVPNGDAARANLDWRTTSANQRALDSSLASGQFQREGGATSLTANVPAAPVITIHAPITINGAHGPEDTANAVKSHLAGEVANVVNQNTTNVVR
jgi:hypothetical protein